MHQPDNASEIQSETIPGSSLDDCVDNDYEIPIDQAYLNHIEEQQDFETIEKAKRVRSKGVLHISSRTHQLLTLWVHRTKPCVTGKHRSTCLHEKSLAMMDEATGQPITARHVTLGTGSMIVRVAGIGCWCAPLAWWQAMSSFIYIPYAYVVFWMSSCEM